MAGRADLDVEGIIGKRGFRLEVIATAADYRDFVIRGMDIWFHRTDFRLLPWDFGMKMRMLLPGTFGHGMILTPGGIDCDELQAKFRQHATHSGVFMAYVCACRLIWLDFRL